MDHRLLILPALVVLGCGPTEDRVRDFGTVWGGGEVTVTFALDSGTGVAGSFTTPGSERATIDDRFLGSTALWSYPWNVEGEPLEHRYVLSVNATETTDVSGLDVSLLCEANLAALGLALSSQDRNRIDFGTSNEYVGERARQFVGIDAPLTATGSVTAEIQWEVLNEYCPAEGDDLSIGAGTVTIDWAFDPASEFVPDDDPIASVSDIPF